MHRTIHIEQVSKIEYASFRTEADMNLYEIYFINIWKPPLNIDDKCKDDLTVELPPVEWKTFTTGLWDKWKDEIEKSEQRYKMRKQEKKAQLDLLRSMRNDWRMGKITEDEYYSFKERVESEKNV
jgi:hypothetical protein